MKINVTFLPTEVSGMDLSNTVCIVLDIFRATTSITTAMANGCEAIHPVISVEEAHQVAQRLGSCLLAGERQSIRIEGFDLGNSPYDFSAAKVKGRRIVMSTTNGTVAIRATEGSLQTLIGSFLNAGAVCNKALESGKDVLIVCAGTDRLFSLEDALCAGLLTEILVSQAAAVILTDSAQAALLMYQQAKHSLVSVAANSRNGRRLADLGREDDVEYCFRINSLAKVPEYRGRVIRLMD